MIHYMSVDGIDSPWVAYELRQVQRAQIPVVLHTLRKAREIAHEADWAMQIDRETRPIYPLPVIPFIKSIVLGPFVFRSRYLAALSNAIFGRRESFRVRMVALVHFFVAAYWAISLRSERVSLIHSQWIHSGGTVAMYGAWLLGVPFSFTGHAADLFRQRAALKDKVERAAFIVCISKFHRQFFLDMGAKPEKLTIVYCGIDLELFKPMRNIEKPKVFTILSAGRLVEKKGFGYLIEACEILRKRGRTFKCVIAGSGAIEGDLREKVCKANLEQVVFVSGQPFMQGGIPEFMAQGNVFCLPCVWARDDDVDGLPQLLMEAMACGLPAISTQLVGIPDLIEDGKTGILVPPENAVELADAIEFSMDNEGQLDVIAANACRHVESQFNLDTCVEPLLDRFRTHLD